MKNLHAFMVEEGLVGCSLILLPREEAFSLPTPFCVVGIEQDVL
jgi:hypothetical protein